MSSWDDKDWGWGSWDWDQPSWGQSSWDDWDWDWDDWDWEEDSKENWKGESLDKRQEESLDKRQEGEEKQNTWRTGASDAAPLSKKRNKGRPAGTGTVSHKRRLHYQRRSYEKRIAREQAEAELKKQEEEEEKRLKEEKDKKKKQEDEEKEKREAEKAEKEKPKVKEEDKKEEKTTLAQRVGPNPAKGVQEVQISSGESMSTSEDMSSSKDSMDNRDSRANQKGRGQTPKLEFGPSRLEVVKEEQAARNKTAAKKKPEEKASSSSRGPAAMDTSLDQREGPAPTSLDQREDPAPTSLDKRDKPQIAIDHHNVLEVKGHIYPQSIRGLDRLRQLGYKVHLVSYCGENRWRQVHSEALGAWDGWESMTRTDQRCGPNGKVEYLLSQGISVLIDDTAEILQEALIKGIRVYPITTPNEKHVWNKGNKPAGATFCHRYLADAINCFILDENKSKKQWQVKN